MTRTGFWTIATAAALAAVVFADPADAQRQRRMSLSDRMELIEQRMAALETAGEDGEQRQAMADMVAAVNELRQDLAGLRGLIEDQGFEIEQIQSAQQDQYLDLDRRLSALTQPPQIGGPIAAFPSDPSLGPGALPAGTQPGNTAPFGEQPIDDRPFGSDPVETDPVFGELPEVREPIDAELETTGIGDAPDPTITAMADPAMEKADYDNAFDALKEGRYAESARLFAAFVDRYPNGEYADNAQYWLGESYYVTGNYRIALDAFQKLIGRFPASSKVPDAKLKLGFTHYELEQWEGAQQVLAEVIEDYPDTTPARLAENRLRMMRIEGNIQ